MIKNTPTTKDYQKLAGECLNQAFDLIYSIDKDRNLIEDNEVSMQKVWKHNQGTLRTAIVLIHQGIEAFMKATICNVSPLLLVENKRNEWPTLPDSADKDFGDLYTIGADALLYTYCAVTQTKVSARLVAFVEEVRIKRNAIVHGIAAEELSPVVIIEMILNSYTLFSGKDSWWHIMREQFISDPLFGVFDSDYEIASFGFRLDYIENVLGKGKLSKHLSQNIKSRRYFCPDCKYAVEDRDGEMYSKWAYLRPNEPSCKTVFCLNCQGSFQVERINCENEGCNGNVLYYEGKSSAICLTCGEEQMDN
jgi:hypothetical protein